MEKNNVFEKDQKYIAHTYHRFSVAVKSGNGAQAEDFEGKRYIDFGSGIGTNSLGFCNDKWIQAVVSQVKQLQPTSNLFYTLPDSLLAERLCKVTGYSKVFFGNSGAEANEEIEEAMLLTAEVMDSYEGRGRYRNKSKMPFSILISIWP